MFNKNIVARLLMSTIIVLPLITWGGYYERPKVFAFLILGFCLSLFWLFKIVFRSKKIVLSRTDFFYLGWLVILIIASLAGVHPVISIVGGSYRYQGVLFFFTLWLIYKTIQDSTTSLKLFLYRGVALSVLIESIIVFVQFVSGRLYFDKPLGTLGEVNAVAGFLAIGSYYVFSYLPVEFFTIPVISLLITQSKSGLIALLPNLLIITKNLSGKIIKIIITLLGLGVATIMIYSALSPSPSFIENRSQIWKHSVNSILQKPVLGFGAESGEAVFAASFAQVDIILNGLIIDRAHNLFLDVAMWSGIIGLTFFAGFLITYFRSFKNKYQKLALVSFFIYSMFQPLSVSHWLLLILL